MDKKSGALVCYGFGHENNYIRGRRYRILEVDINDDNKGLDWVDLNSIYYVLNSFYFSLI